MRLRKKGQKRPPSRRLIRHVLRARAEAANALAAMLAHLEASPTDIRVRASSHLALRYGGSVDQPSTLLSPSSAAEVNGDGSGEMNVVDEPSGWRSAREVVAFLRKRGAKIASLKEDVSGAWAAALSSDNDVSDSDAMAEDVVWVPPSSSSNLK
jgi:glycerol-3-phosphate O-acyltransferase / dihydroxyacetone phosphate acyltransferase